MHVFKNARPNTQEVLRGVSNESNCRCMAGASKLQEFLARSMTLSISPGGLVVFCFVFFCFCAAPVVLCPVVWVGWSLCSVWVLPGLMYSFFLP
jgi:hypothetical protein